MNDNLKLTNTIKTKLFSSVVLGLFLASAMATQATAQTILIDDFNDGNADGWTVSDGSVGQSWGPGTIEVNRSGAYHFESSGLVPGGQASPLSARWDQSSDPIFANGFLRAKIKVHELGSAAGLVLRSSPGNGYVFWGTTANNGILGNGGFRINKNVNGRDLESRQVPGNFPFGVNEDWYIEAGAVGDQLSMKVWRVGDPEPESPQLTWQDGTFSAGYFLVGAWKHGILAQPARTSATIDDIYFRFPEHDDPFTPAPYDIYLWGSPMPLPQEEGPFFVAGSPEKPDMRGDVTKTESWPDLLLKGNITDFQGRPIPGLKLDFWQADDKGSYDNSGGHNLRGHLFTDTEGNYNLWTVMPSNYEVIRTRHLHLKIGGQNLDFDSPVYTTQLYFPAPYDSDIDADGTADKVVQAGFETEFDAITLEEDFITIADLEAVGAEFSDLAGNIVMVNNDPATDEYFDTTLDFVMPEIFQSPEMAKRILIDNFNDGDADGWTTHDTTIGDPYGPGIFQVSRTGAYHLETTAIVPGPGLAFLSSTWDDSSDPIFSDGYVRAKVRAETRGSTAAIMLRYNTDNSVNPNLYIFFGTTANNGIPGNGAFLYNKVVNGQTVQVRQLPANLRFGVNEWWNIEAGAVGNQLSMKVWRVGDPEPESPQLKFTDSSFSTGKIGIESNIHDYPFPGPERISATFDDIYFIPADPDNSPGQ